MLVGRICIVGKKKQAYHITFVRKCIPICLHVSVLLSEYFKILIGSSSPIILPVLAPLSRVCWIHLLCVFLFGCGGKSLTSSVLKRWVKVKSNPQSRPFLANTTIHNGQALPTKYPISHQALSIITLTHYPFSIPPILQAKYQIHMLGGELLIFPSWQYSLHIICLFSPLSVNYVIFRCGSTPLPSSNMLFSRLKNNHWTLFRRLSRYGMISMPISHYISLCSQVCKLICFSPSKLHIYHTTPYKHL